MKALAQLYAAPSLMSRGACYGPDDLANRDRRDSGSRVLFALFMGDEYGIETRSKGKRASPAQVAAGCSPQFIPG